MIPVFDTLDLTDHAAVRDALVAGADANRSANCRVGSIDRIGSTGRLVATGDLHDNPVHLARIIDAAGMSEPGATPRAHVTLHEVIHGEHRLRGMDFSFRVLARVAHLKSLFPEHVHTLLANHELAQIVGSGVIKDGVQCVDAFNDAIDHTFGDDAPPIHDAIGDFIRSMPLALRATHDGGDILCAHSLPAPYVFEAFDATVIERDLEESDYEPRKGSAHLMVWGRNHTPEVLKALAERWNVRLFILGHENAETGIQPLPPNTIILNSDHERGVYLPVDLADPPSLAEASMMMVPLAVQRGI